MTEINDVLHPRINPYDEDKANLQALMDLLDLKPVCIRLSPYRGFELVLEWNPNYRCITVVGSGTGRGIVYCYSKTKFPGAHWDGLGYWELRL